MNKLFRRTLLAFILVMVLLLPASTVLADTTANVTVTATGAFVSYSANQTTYNFGTIAASSTTNTTADWILFTNTSSVSTNISVKMLAENWTSVGAGWIHDDAAAGVNTAAMKAASDNAAAWGASVFVKFNSPFNEIGTAIAAGSSYSSGLSLLAPTSFTDGNSNNNTVQFGFYQE